MQINNNRTVDSFIWKSLKQKKNGNIKTLQSLSHNKKDKNKK